MKSWSHHVDLERASNRSQAPNHPTRFADCRRSLQREIQMNELFNALHPQLADRIAQRPERGVMVIAVSPDEGIVGSLWLKAGVELVSATLGRHTAADLYLSNAGLSLRHLLVHTCLDGTRVRTKIIELEAGAGLLDEHGDALSACEVDGFAALRIGSVALFLCTTGVPLPWNPRVANPWGSIAERTYLDRVVTAGLALRMPVRGRATTVESLESLDRSRGQHTPPNDGPPAGHLALRSGGQELRIPISRLALNRGVLIGRYERCQGHWGCPVRS